MIRTLIQRLDPSYGGECPIYTIEGEWSYSRFERWLASIGVYQWPRLKTGALDLRGDAFQLMSHIAGIEGLHALRKSLAVIKKAQLPIGRDGRNRPSLFPFGTATGRNAHAKSLFNAHAGMRSFMTFSPDVIAVYLDWRTQEVGIAAQASGDPALMEDYRRGDVYHALARTCGLTDDDDWALEREQQTSRHRMKGLQLGINYGMSIPSLAKVWMASGSAGILSNATSANIQIIGVGVRGKLKLQCSIAFVKAHLDGQCASATAPTSAPCTIFLCSRTVLRCYASQRGDFARPE